MRANSIDGGGELVIETTSQPSTTSIKTRSSFPNEGALTADVHVISGNTLFQKGRLNGSTILCSYELQGERLA